MLDTLTRYISSNFINPKTSMKTYLTVQNLFVRDHESSRSRRNKAMPTNDTHGLARVPFVYWFYHDIVKNNSTEGIKKKVQRTKAEPNRPAGRSKSVLHSYFLTVNNDVTLISVVFGHYKDFHATLSGQI